MESEEHRMNKQRRIKKTMDNTVIIGVDHGWSQMKTAETVFSSGVEEILSEPAFSDDVLKYRGIYLRVGTKRDAVMENKTVNDDYYFLTLASMAKEMARRKINEAKVILATGLPVTRYGAEKKSFIEYLSRNKDIRFEFEGKEYKIELEKVAVYPQGYAAVADLIGKFGKKMVVVDIGSWTIDIIPIGIDGRPDEASANTIAEGLIPCMRRINKQCMRLYNEKIDEETIKQYIITGKTDLDEQYVKIMDSNLKAFSENVFNSLREEGYSLKTTNFCFTGGGATVMKQFGGYNQKNIMYVLDVHANAKGYETLTKAALERKARAQ